MDLCDINQIKALLARHGFRFSKSMGQNFLIQSWVPADIAHSSGAAPGKGVLEVGPGIGPLTRELSARADKVVSVELDKALYPILAETLADRDNVEIVPGDILKTDIAALAAEKFAGLDAIACANLPYNITTPAITALIEAGCFSAITVMIPARASLGMVEPKAAVRPLSRVLRRWAKAARTTRKKKSASSTSAGAGRGTSRRTEEVTLGAGMKHSGGTSKSSSQWAWYWQYREKAP